MCTLRGGGTPPPQHPHLQLVSEGVGTARPIPSRLVWSRLDWDGLDPRQAFQRRCVLPVGLLVSNTPTGGGGANLLRLPQAGQKGLRRR